jgi:predicted ATPase
MQWGPRALCHYTLWGYPFRVLSAGEVKVGRVLRTVAIRGYRSLREVILPLGRLSIVTGENGVGKSSLYRALRLLADCGRGEVIGSLAREGGLESVLWAGPEQLGAARRTGKAQGTARNRPVSLELGFAADDFGYLVDLVADTFDGASISVVVNDGLFDLQLRQRGMLRPLRAAELSDGTLRFLLWAAALLSPQAPSLMVLNEPETSLHRSLVGPLASLIRTAALQTQVVVVTHSRSLLRFLQSVPVAEAAGSGEAARDAVVDIELYKDFGETRITGQSLLTTPRWDWGKR